MSRLFAVVVLSVFLCCNGWSVTSDPKDSETLNVGVPFAVLCRLSDIDPEQERPGLVWTKVNGDLSNRPNVKLQRLDDFTMSMFLANGTVDDSGTYECHASYQGVTKTTAISIQFKANMVFTEEEEPSGEVPIVGNEVRMSCEVSGPKRENLMVMWQKDIVALTAGNNKEYIFADNGHTIYIPNVVFERDVGSFVCKVLNTQTGEMITKSFKIERECLTMCKKVCDFLTGPH
ncbi:hypothetical protein L596_003253 [Steinernema carpocapsae]|uniref:Ig-like domain-containing protein n=1 Tax=Steinernema carpocapsae TaxID=34508 RepID=A0A4U8UUW2_STECR|nr:hypothetical protein L596_003253 [Steinernema carpocapsae]